MAGLDFDPGFDRNEWEDRKDYYKPQTIDEDKHDTSKIAHKIIKSGDNRKTVVAILKFIGGLIVVVGVLAAVIMIVKVFQFAFL